MKQSKASLSLLLLAVLSVTVLAVTPASAERSNFATMRAHAAQGSSNDTTEVATTDGMTTDSEGDMPSGMTMPAHGVSAAHLAALKSKAQSEVADLRQGKPETTVAHRQKLCENRQKAVDNKLKAFDNAADLHLTKLNDIFTKLQNYQTEKQLNVTNYQTLVDSATAKQQAATTAVASLKAVAVSIDCTSTDPASSLTVVKDAAAQARQALQDYRMSLKDIVVAMAQSNQTSATTTTTTDTSTGSND